MKKIIIITCFVISTLAFGQNKYTSKLLGSISGDIIKVTNGDEIHPLASVTKMMTLLLTFESLSRNEISMKNKVKIPEKFRHIGGSRIWMGRNDVLSVEDLIKATAIYSANNAAYSLANYVGKNNLEIFVESMNRRAKELGMENTKYYTPAGLPPYMTGKKMDVSTVEDIYKLSRELLKYPRYLEIASLKKTSIRGGGQEFNNRNKLLGTYGVYGLKTGHHDAAGYNISIVSKRNNINVIEIVFGSPTEKIRDEVVIKDLDDLYKNYNYVTLLKKGREMAIIPIKDGVTSQVRFYANEDLERLIDKNVEIESKVILRKKLKFPIEIGTVLGDYEILLDGKLYITKQLIADKKIKEKNIFQKIFN
ncbi:MAG: D-alanyl-D-alanine carboxypeptidase [Psychrilyobacter sp.]|nr:D-alanyl-D-alanine carboxypeptidase [Psychrilyobacter sp.]